MEFACNYFFTLNIFLGVGLRDSPMGLAAYMLEKFSTLTNPNYRNLEDAGLTEKFTLEQLLDNVMIFWVTECMTSAMRIYAQYFSDFDMNIDVFHGYFQLLNIYQVRKTDAKRILE